MIFKGVKWAHKQSVPQWDSSLSWSPSHGFKAVAVMQISVCCNGVQLQQRVRTSSSETRAIQTHSAPRRYSPYLAFFTPTCHCTGGFKNSCRTGVAQLSAALACSLSRYLTQYLSNHVSNTAANCSRLRGKCFHYVNMIFLVVEVCSVLVQP